MRSLKGKDGELSSKKSQDDRKAVESGVGQGELYSPEFARKLSDIQDGMISLTALKESLLAKLSAVAAPADALDGARIMLESIARDVSVAAQALSKDALQRIKSRLRDVVPSVSPDVTAKMVDEAEKETVGDHKPSSKL